MGCHGLSVAAFVLLVFGSALATYVDPNVLDACPGYNAIDVQQTRGGLTAQLVLRDKPCNVFGDDIEKLLLTVEYETSMLSARFPCLGIQP